MAAFEQELPAGVSARALDKADLTSAVALSTEAGWNQISADWQIFLEFGSAVGLFRAHGKLIATAATIPYSGRFAWISMLLVSSSERRKGLARWLLSHCVERLQKNNLLPVLDATSAGRSVYSRFGFRDAWSMRRLVGRVPLTQCIDFEPGGLTVRRLKATDWPQVIEYDAQVFGADRGTLLHHLAERLPAATMVAEHKGHFAGFLLGRNGRVMNQLGPLIAESADAARALLLGAFTAVRTELSIDVPERHAAVGDWLVELGMGVERPLTRMVFGENAPFDQGDRLFAIAGPELG
jgi:GNAT superfamily N-acetyltransferase